MWLCGIVYIDIYYELKSLLSILNTNSVLFLHMGHLLFLTWNEIICLLTKGKWRKHPKLSDIDITTRSKIGVYITSTDVGGKDLFKIVEMS